MVHGEGLLESKMKGVKFCERELVSSHPNPYTLDVMIESPSQYEKKTKLKAHSLEGLASLKSSLTGYGSSLSCALACQLHG